MSPKAFLGLACEILRLGYSFLGELGSALFIHPLSLYGLSTDDPISVVTLLCSFIIVRVLFVYTDVKSQPQHLLMKQIFLILKII